MNVAAAGWSNIGRQVMMSLMAMSHPDQVPAVHYMIKLLVKLYTQPVGKNES